VTAERWWLGLWKCVDPEMKFKMVSDSKQGFWSRLTSQEKEKLFELIEYSDGQNTAKPKQYIGMEQFEIAFHALNRLS